MTSPSPYKGTDVVVADVPTEPVRAGSGQTLLRTKPGYEFNHGVQDVPVITSAGVYVTAAQAEKILTLDEPTGLVYKDNQEGE